MIVPFDVASPIAYVALFTKLYCMRISLFVFYSNINHDFGRPSCDVWIHVCVYGRSLGRGGNYALDAGSARGLQRTARRVVPASAHLLHAPEGVPRGGKASVRNREAVRPGTDRVRHWLRWRLDQGEEWNSGRPREAGG